MTVSKALRRLLRIRDLEEEQSRAVLESAIGELHNLETARGAVAERARRGRGLVKASARNGELPDRLSGLEESCTAERHAVVLDHWIGEARTETTTLREKFLAKRVERLQVETLIQEAEAQDKIDTDRRSQQAADEWYRVAPARRYREGRSGPAPK